ncbi:MAG TPA: hypothetical protein VLU25_08945 [Acidobacteriota bacterium]|nr:hypothetical protein [Acidobacteriota bacterium]
MLDKYKVLRNAERFVIEKKFSQAIQEYEKLLEKDSNDAGLLNTIGDLYVRVQNYPKALKRFHKVAEIYLRSGFALRAIATYKKIHSLDPSDVQVNQRLAELFQKQGLNQDARRHMQFLVDHSLEEGDNKAAITWMKRVVDLDSSAWNTQLKLAEMLSRADSPSESAYYYREAVRTLQKRQRHEQIMEACETAFQNAEYESELVEAYAQAAERLSRIQQAEEKMRQSLEESGRELPYKLALALLAERRGDAEGAHKLFSQLSDAGHFETVVSEGLQRTASAAPGVPASQPHDAIDLDLGADADLGEEEEDQEQEDQSFDFGGQQWDSDEEQGSLQVGESPFHPAGEVEEFVLPDEEDEDSFQDSGGSGLFLQDDDVEVDQSEALGSGLLLEDEEDVSEQTAESFQLELEEDEEEEDQDEQPAPELISSVQDEQELSGEAELAAMGVIELEEEKADEASLEPELVEEEEGDAAAAPQEDLDDIVISSLEEALEETDFYLKLGFQDEATRLLKVLLRDFGDEERVLRRAKKIPGLAPSAPAPKQAAAEGPQAEGFEDELDAALDALFEPGAQDQSGEVLRYDVQGSSAASQEENPSVHYDLGLAYKEMGLIADAAQEFRGAVDLLGEGQEPLKILCCSMLANCYLNLKEYDRAIRWAREGLAIEDMKDFEWKALQYDLACALQSRGEAEEARQALLEITEKDDSYRDVKERLEQLASAD